MRKETAMEEKKLYRNAIRSRQMIRGAFMELLQEKPYEKITFSVMGCEEVKNAFADPPSTPTIPMPVVLWTKSLGN